MISTAPTKIQFPTPEAGRRRRPSGPPLRRRPEGAVPHLAVALLFTVAIAHERGLRRPVAAAA